MPRKPRVEYSGATYHVMSRGNRGELIFLNNNDCETFIYTLDEACTKTGWLVHAFVLMGNHYHLLLETPEPQETLEPQEPMGLMELMVLMEQDLFRLPMKVEKPSPQHLRPMWS